MKERIRCRACQSTIAIELAKKLRQAGLSAEYAPNTLGKYMAKVRIHLGDTDHGYICVYSSYNSGVKYRTHEMKMLDLKDVIEACWNNRVDVARALLGLVEGAEIPAFDEIPYHAYVASHGPHGVSGYSIAVTSNDELEGYVEGAVGGSQLEAETAGVTKLLKRCADRRIERVVVHAGVELLRLAAGITKPSNSASRKFVAEVVTRAGKGSDGGIAEGRTCEILWLPRDEASKGYRSALRRSGSVYEKRWFEVA